MSKKDDSIAQLVLLIIFLPGILFAILNSSPSFIVYANNCAPKEPVPAYVRPFYYGGGAAFNGSSSIPRNSYYDGSWHGFPDKGLCPNYYMQTATNKYVIS